MLFFYSLVTPPSPTPNDIVIHHSVSPHSSSLTSSVDGQPLCQPGNHFIAEGGYLLVSNTVYFTHGLKSKRRH